jgi:hypothetical protein
MSPPTPAPACPPRAHAYTGRLRLDLSFNSRDELTQLALEQHRSSESQATYMLEQVLRRSRARRQTPTPD